MKERLLELVELYGSLCATSAIYAERNDNCRCRRDGVAADDKLKEIEELINKLVALLRNDYRASF